MNVTRNSRKRSHKSQPLSARFTRSSSHLFLHRNRSGQIRPDPVRFPRQMEPHSVPVPVPKQVEPCPVPVPVPFDGNGARQGYSDSEFKILIDDICKQYSESDPEDDILLNDICKKAKRDDDDLTTATMKDLRARRVYSPQSNADKSSGLIGSALSNGSASGSDRKTAELGFGTSTIAENGGTHVDGVTDIPDLGFSCETQNFDQGNTESSDGSEKLQDDMQIDGKDGGYCVEKIDDFDEEPVQTTPPDVVICGNLELDGYARKTEEALPVEDSQRTDSVLKRKSVRGLRLPGKLFKAPGSVSYRRLFPYLLDIMGDDFGIPKSGLCHKDEKVMEGQGLELPLSSDNHEPTTPEVKTDSCMTRDINGSKLTSSPMRLDIEEVNGKCLSAPSVDGKCVGESKIDSTANFHSARVVGNALGHNDFKQYSIHQNNFDCAKDTNHIGCTSEQLVVLNEDCIPMTGDAEIYDNSELNVDQMQSMPQNACHVKPMDSTRSTQQNAIEPHKNKHVPRPYLHGKLIKSPGSVNYRRLLPFLKNLNKDDSGTSKFGDQTHHRKHEVDLYANGFQLPLPSPSEEPSIVTGPMHDKVESTILENILVNPAVMLSHDDRPKLISSLDFSELPMHLDVKEDVHECLSASSSVQAQSEKIVIGSNDECLSEAKTDFHCVKNLTNDFNQVRNPISGQHNMESPPKDQHLPKISDDIFNLSFEHHSSQEQGFTTNCDEINQFLNLEMHESVNRCPPEGQTVSQLDANMIDAEENGKSSLAICKSDDVVVLSHVNISNEEPRQPSEKIISEKLELPDMAEHGEKAGSLLNGLVYGSKMLSKGSSNKYASCASVIKNGSEFKTTPVLNRCPRDKLLKHAGSVNYKRLLPFLLNTVKSNPSPSNNDHRPKLQKLLDQTPFLSISDTNLRLTPLSDSNDCAGNSGAKKETGLQASDLNNNSSSPISQTPEFQSLHGSCNVVQLQDEHVLNGLYKLENSISSPISVHRDLLVTPIGPITDEIITRGEEATPALSNEAKPSETYGCCQSLPQLKVTDQLKSPAAGFQKGILRRNPRGCRGLCTCLNCVSFRLHSERAFEFSRNQLLDAEEVAQDLMKELSHVRNMLENSANSTTALDGSQVLEACRKAFETEQLAKDRLSQMNDELNIHCRTPSLQRPSVKFSDYVKEKVFQSGSQING